MTSLSNDRLAAEIRALEDRRCQAMIDKDMKTLEAVYADGRRATLRFALETESAASEGADDPDASLGVDDPSGGPQLSPQLLSNYPNPFRSSTRVSFRIPATLGEAFVWDDQDAPPADLLARSPFADAIPSVSVTVYSLEGREVATLFAGSVGVGTYEAQWDGRDRQGRTMASGAYFCKLQIDKWSVTKRLIFIR